MVHDAPQSGPIVAYGLPQKAAPQVTAYFFSPLLPCVNNLWWGAVNIRQTDTGYEFTWEVDGQKCTLLIPFAESQGIRVTTK